MCIIQIFCTLILNESAVLHSQTSWIMQVLSYKLCNVRLAKDIKGIEDQI